MVRKIYTHDFFLKCLERDGATLDKSKELPKLFNAHATCPYICKCGRPSSKELYRLHKDGALCIECKGSKRVYDDFTLLRHCRENNIKLVTIPTQVTYKTVIEGYCKNDNCNNTWEKGFACLIDEVRPYSGAYCMECMRSKQANAYRDFVSTETTKRCSECKTFRDKGCFGKDSHTWDLLKTTCKKCVRERAVQKKEWFRSYQKTYYLKNKSKIDTRNKRWMEENRERRDSYYKKYMMDPLNIKRAKIRSRKSYEKHREKVLLKSRLRFKNNRERYRILNNAWRKKNKRKIEAKRRERMKTDENFATKMRIRGRLSKIFKGKVKWVKTKELTGISDWEHISNYLKHKSPVYNPLFQKIHIDHIICCDAFDFTNPFHVIACCHYTNLQYLTENENTSKRVKLPPDFDFDTWLQKQLVQIARIENEKLSWEDVLQLQKDGIFQGYITDEMKWW
jgi:hypothetical protein